MNKYKFSLVLPTLNRPKFISECLKSLENQIYKDFEVIIVDQSDNELTTNVVDEFKKGNIISIKYYKVSFKGLSKARNYAINNAKGKYICLLDDDARYDVNFLKIAKDSFELYESENIILSGKIIDDKINEDFVNYSCAKNKDIFTDERIFKICLSAALIIPKKDLENIGLFDERLGIGEYFGAAEETDVILRLIYNGFKIIHLSDMLVYHLKPININSNLDLMKVYKYALGGGALFKKHIIVYKNKKIIIRYVRSLIVPFVKLIFNILDEYNRRKYFYILKGHIKGFLEFD